MNSILRALSKKSESRISQSVPTITTSALMDSGHGEKAIGGYGRAYKLGQRKDLEPKNYYIRSPRT